MKKIFNIIVSLVCAASLAACTESGIRTGEVDLGYLKLISSDVDFDYNGGTGKIVADTDQALTAVVDAEADWATATVVGNVVAVSAPPYSGAMLRFTTVTLSAGGRSVNVSVSQSAFGISFDSQTLQFTANAGSKVATYSAVLPAGVDGGMENFKYEVSTLDSWITTSVDNETRRVTVAVATNSNLPPRSGVISLSANGQWKSDITVNQAGRTITTADMAGTWRVNCQQDEYVGQYYNADVTITALEGNKVNIKGLNNTVPEANFEATLNPTALTLEIAAGTIVNESGTQQMYIHRFSGSDVISIPINTSAEPLFMNWSSYVNGESVRSLCWGFRLAGTGISNWRKMYTSTSWTKQVGE